MADTQEHCARCHEGLYYVVAETEQNEHLHCFYCQYHESRVKEGFEVVEPGAPIQPVGKGKSEKGGDE